MQCGFRCLFVHAFVPLSKNYTGEIFDYGVEPMVEGLGTEGVRPALWVMD